MSSHRLLASLVGMFSLVLAGCGGGDGEPGGTVASDPPRPSTTASSPTAGLVPTSEAAEQPTSAPVDEAVVIEVVVADGAVTPAGERISVDRGGAVALVVTSDVAGEFHVHSSPESYEGFAAGTNAPIELQFDRPGLIEIELHEPFEGPVVELEVS